MIAYDSNEFHKANNFFNENNKRLTLVFFIKDITIDTKWPSDKIGNTESFDNHIEQLILKNENIKSTIIKSEETDISDK